MEINVNYENNSSQHMRVLPETAADFTRELFLLIASFGLGFLVPGGLPTLPLTFRLAASNFLWVTLLSVFFASVFTEELSSSLIAVEDLVGFGPIKDDVDFETRALFFLLAGRTGRVEVKDEDDGFLG
jgi:hypothetical protein